MPHNRRTADRIHAALVEQIASGAFAPGQTLSEVDLSQRFGVSRTPVREALSRLDQARLIERGRRRAFVVRTLRPDDLAELFEAVGEVEGVLAAFAALRMSEVERQALATAMQEGEKGASAAPGAYSAVNARFHALIQHGAHNAVLAATLDELNLRTLPWRAAQFEASTARLSTSRAEHRLIVSAIMDRDAEASRQHMRRHIAATFLTLSDILNARNR